MEIVVLGSGSSGNATIIRSGNTTILLEAGLSARQIALRARAAGCRPERISAVFVSHAHSDHVKGAPVFSRRHRVPVFMTDGAYERWRETLGRARVAAWPARAGRSRRAGGVQTHHGPGLATEDVAASGNAGPVGRIPMATNPPKSSDRGDGADFAVTGGWRPEFHARITLEESGVAEVGGVRVRTFPVPHDTDGTVGYIVEAEGMRFGYVTDLGHVTRLVEERLRGCDALLIEMNHDPDLLREGPYPWGVKQRIASRHGHLSNEQGAALLAQSIGSDTRWILLGHLSETNNEPGLALATARLAAERAGRGDVSVVPAEPHRPMRSIRL